MTQTHVPQADLVAAVSEWLDCEDDLELIEAEAEAAEEDMEACTWCQDANIKPVDSIEEEEKEDCQEQLPAVTGEDVELTCALLASELEVFSGMAHRFPMTLHKLEGAMRQF